METAVHRILVATDLSEFSPVLLRQAVKLARQCQAELTVLYVYRLEDYVQSLAETQMPLDRFVEHLRAEMRYQVIGQGWPDAGLPVRFEVRQASNVVEEILLEATRTGADVIVMGTHGRSGLARVLLGSVAEAVLRSAAVPVFVVPVAVLSHPSRAGREMAAGRARNA